MSDARGNHLDANPVAEKLIGYTPEELLKSSRQNLTQSSSARNGSEQAYLTATGTWRGQLELRHKGDQVIPVEALVTVGEIPKGKIYVSAIRDMTQYRLADSQLREEREALAIVNAAGRLLSAELDLDILIQEVTDVATALAGTAMGTFCYNSRGTRGDFYTLYALAGSYPADFAEVPQPRMTQLFGDTFGGVGVVHRDVIRLDPRHAQDPPFFGVPTGHLPAVSYLAAPVFGRQGEVIGGLLFGSPRPGYPLNARRTSRRVWQFSLQSPSRTRVCFGKSSRSWRLASVPKQRRCSSSMP